MMSSGSNSGEEEGRLQRRFEEFVAQARPDRKKRNKELQRRFEEFVARNKLSDDRAMDLNKKYYLTYHWIDYILQNLDENRLKYNRALQASLLDDSSREKKQRPPLGLFFAEMVKKNYRKIRDRDKEMEIGVRLPRTLATSIILYTADKYYEDHQGGVGKKLLFKTEIAAIFLNDYCSNLDMGASVHKVQFFLEQGMVYSPKPKHISLIPREFKSRLRSRSRYKSRSKSKK